MKQTICIRNLHINIYPLVNQELDEKNTSKQKAGNGIHKSVKHYSFIEAPNGIYIATKAGNCWKEEYFSECKEEAVGIAIIKNGHRFVVNKNGSKQSLPLLERDKLSNLKKIPVYRNAIKDFDGYSNTEHLLSLGSPAAKYCRKQREQWYIPSIGELTIMDEYGEDLNRMLLLIGGTQLPENWHWSSTRYSDKCYFVLDWCNGNRNDNIQDGDNWVRPVSASL